ncbi:helix-turn-helix domain-containing protein [Mesorhizobium australicum]|uniref:helix-turn-helix domain-containing protein n=1 Tax=Mesorhizobium australicum TaxID=536018 RepID=UPI003EB8EBB4
MLADSTLTVIAFILGSSLRFKSSDVIQNEQGKALCQADCIGLCKMSISSEQSRAARGLLNWSQGKLSEAAGVARATIAEFEGGKRRPIANNLAAIRAALESAGVEFINGTGVKLRT